MDNSSLYHAHHGRREGKEHEVDRPDISLEDLAAGLTLGSDWEERIKSKSSFGAQPPADNERTKPRRTMNISDIEEYAFSQRLPREPRLSMRAENTKRSEQSLSHPSLENSDRKPIKHAPPDAFEGIIVDHDHEEAHALSRKDPAEDFWERPGYVVEPSHPERSEIAHLLRSEQQEPLPARREVRSLEKNENEADQANEYLLWLERQVEEAVDANQDDNDPVDTIENISAKEIKGEDIVSENEHDQASPEQASSDVVEEDEMLNKAVQMLNTDLYSTAQIQATNESPVKSPSMHSIGDPSTPTAVSPERAPGSIEDKYPPTPSPMPAVKHPRDLAMKAQQQTPTAEWNPLTRILEREDNSADIYPRYHA